MKKKINNSANEKIHFSKLKLLNLNCFFFFIFFLLLIIFQYGNSQPWQQLGPGAGGQERAVYLYNNTLTGKYDLYIGSDVSGVWKAKDINPANLHDETSYNFKYVSNNRIFRFVNTFYRPLGYISNLLYVGSRGGIDCIELTNTAPVTESLNFPTGYDLSQSWVSTIYMGTDVIGTERPMYFITGTTRVNDANGNFKDWNDATNPVYDFYYGTIDVGTGKVVSITNQFSFPDWGGNTTHNAFCMFVDEHGSGNTDDEFYIGTELGLYHFTNPANLGSATRLAGPNGATDYKVTSITKVGTGNEFLITVSDINETIGGLWKYSSTNGWTPCITRLEAERKTDATCTVALRDIAGEDSTRYFTKVLPLKDVSNTIIGWLLFNEKNILEFNGNALPCDRGPYFAGVFYAPKSSSDDFPDVNWTALETYTAGNEWGWNASKPCSNINGALLTPENHLIIGKQGNIFITQNSLLPTPVNTNWQQIYTREISNYCNTDNAYYNAGYVNTATQTIYPEGNGKVWFSDRDRQISYSDNHGMTSMQVTINSSCKIIAPNASQDPCNEYSIIPDYKFSDCFFITENKANPVGDLHLYAGIAEGYGQKKGRGLILEYDPTGTAWTQLGNAICGDPTKMLFTATGQKYLLVKDAPTELSKVYKLNGTNWNKIDLIDTGENILDAVASPHGDTLIVIKGNGNDKGVYSLRWTGSTWSIICSTLINSSVVKPKSLILLPYSNGPGELLYKVLCGTSPRIAMSYISNLYEVFDNKQPSVCTATPITRTSPSATNDIFKYLNIDNIDFIDEGVTAIEVNEQTRTIYVGVVRTDPSNTYEVESHLYRNTFDYNTGFISANAWTDISGMFSANRELPNKSFFFLNAHGSQTCNEYMYASIRGLGPWKFEIPAFDIGSATTVNITCNGANDGSITINPAGGEQPYSYSLDGTIFQAGNTFNNLSPGNYTITVSDNRGCTSTTTATISQPAVLTAVANPTAVLCFGGSTGNVSLTVSGGTTNYSYSWSNGAITQNLNNIIAGVYTVTVTDANGCTVSTTATVTQPNVLSATLTPTMPSCFGSNNGKIDVSATGGTPLYTYLWNTGASGTTISGLTTGIYTVTVTDANGCTFTSSINLTQPTQLSATASQTLTGCTGSNIGEIQATVNGGTLGYTYSWSPLGGTNATATGLPPGNYTVSITDANGCATTTSVTIIEDENCCGVFGSSFIYSPGSNPPSGSYDLNASFSVASGTTLTLSTCTLAIAKNVTITVESNATLEILASSFLYACGEMWVGIINNGGTVTIDNSTIKDAIIAGRTSGGNSMNVRNSQFDNNFISLYYENGDFSATGPYGASDIYGNTFDNNGGALTKAPHLGEDSPYHIYVNYVSAINIGDPAQSANTFHNGLKGIYVEKGTAIAKHNVFNNVGSDIYQNRPVYPPPAYVTPNGAIVAVGDGATAYNLTVGGSAANESNTFNGCEVGVAAQSSINTTVSHNTLDLCNSGIILQNIYRCTNLIEYNTITKYATGISLLDVAQNTSTIIDHNLLNNGMGYDATHEGVTGIDIQNTYPNSDNLSVSYNTVENTQKDIHLLNLGGCLVCNQATLLIATIEHNTLNQVIDNSSLVTGGIPYYGIWAQNGYQLNISNNPIIWTGTADPDALLLMKGIDISDSKSCTLKENIITNFGAGVNVFGYCSRTNLLCNDMQYCYNGVYFDPNSTTSLLNTQGVYTGSQSTSVSWDNKWTGNIGTNKVDGNTWNGQQIFWVYDPNANAFYSPILSAGFLNPEPGDLHNGCIIPAVLDEEERDRMFGSAVGDSTQTDGMDSLEFVINNEESFYRHSKQDSSILTMGNPNDAAFQEKYDSLQQSSMGRFSDVLDSIASGNNQYALQLLSQISPDNLIEQNKKFILSIIAAGYNPATDADGDTIDLINYIAITHPFYGGDAVYWARGILHLLIKDQLPPNRHAQNPNSSNGNGKKNVLNGKLYPNPGSNDVTLNYPLAKNQIGLIAICDVYGKTIANYKFKELSIKFNVSNLFEAVYFVHVYIDNALVETHRLIVIK